MECHTLFSFAAAIFEHISDVSYILPHHLSQRSSQLANGAFYQTKNKKGSNQLLPWLCSYKHVQLCLHNHSNFPFSPCPRSAAWITRCDYIFQLGSLVGGRELFYSLQSVCFCICLNSWFSNCLPRSWCILAGKPNFKAK